LNSLFTLNTDPVSSVVVRRTAKLQHACILQKIIRSGCVDSDHLRNTGLTIVLCPTVYRLQKFTKINPHF